MTQPDFAPGRLLGHGMALFVTIVWGTTFISSKLLLAAFTPLEIMTFRFVIAWTVLLLLSPHPIRPKGLRGELPFLGAGLTGLTLYFILENTALEYTPCLQRGHHHFGGPPCFPPCCCGPFTDGPAPPSFWTSPVLPQALGASRPHPAGPVALPAALIHKKIPASSSSGRDGYFAARSGIIVGLVVRPGASTTTGSSAGASTVSSVQPQPQSQV